MPDFTRGVPYDQEGHKLCVACFRPQLGGTSFACSSCWHELSQINRDEVMRSEVRVNRGQLPRWIINTGSAPLSGSAMPGGMVETKAYDPMCDVADVMARAQGKCDFGAQKELWNYIVGELADRFMRNGKVGADFIYWCHGGSGGGGAGRPPYPSYSLTDADMAVDGRATMRLDEPIPTWVARHAQLAAGYGMSQAHIHDYIPGDPIQDSADMAQELVRSMQPPVASVASMDYAEAERRLILQATEAQLHPPQLVEGPQMTAAEVAARIVATHAPTVQDIAEQAGQSMIDRYLAQQRRRLRREP